MLIICTTVKTGQKCEYIAAKIFTNMTGELCSCMPNYVNDKIYECIKKDLWMCKKNIALN